MARRTHRPANPLRIHSWLLAGAIALSLATGAHAVEIRGSLNLSGKPKASPPAPQSAPYWEEWNGFLEPKEPRFSPERELAVVLRGRSSDGPSGCDYAVQGGSLAPATVVAKVGSTLRIENTDGCSHELFAEGNEAFGVMPTAPGNARTLKVNETGKWAIKDRLYPHVSGHLHVIADLVACGEVDAQGRFRFADVGPGQYKLSVFLGDKEVGRSEVSVDERRELTLDPINVRLGSR